ncbi:MAG: hypothetical protein ACK443_02090 [Methylococcaceae bacterium]|jgi:hypothetical protein
MNHGSASRQTGLVLSVALVMLSIMTVIAVAAVSQSLTHMRLVGNLQAHIESETTLWIALETLLSNDAEPLFDGTCTPHFTLPICMNLKLTEVIITAHCETLPSSDTARSERLSSALWDISASINDSNTSAHSTMHLGFKAPPPSTCPRAGVNCEFMPAPVACPEQEG